MATPLVPVAEIESAPLAKVAEPWAPRLVFRVARKVAGVKAVPAAPLTLIVPAVKSIATVRCTTPDALVIATVDWPVKPVAAGGRSRPGLGPWGGVGGG